MLSGKHTEGVLPMENKFIELTVTSRDYDGSTLRYKHVIGVAHIAMFFGLGGPSKVTLGNGTEISVTETYDELKRMLGL
jgi:hypothetical protein